MARGVDTNALQNAQSIEANNAGLQAQQQQQNKALTQQYQAIASNPGYTPAQQSSITNATLGGLGSTYDSLTQNAQNTAARTNNGSSYNDMLDQLSRSRGSQVAGAEASNAAGFAQNAQQQQMQALQGLSGLYGTNTNFLNSQMGLPVGYLNAATNAGKSGFLSSLGNTMGSALGGIASGGIGGALGSLPGLGNYI